MQPSRLRVQTGRLHHYQVKLYHYQLLAAVDAGGYNLHCPEKGLHAMRAQMQRQTF